MKKLSSITSYLLIAVMIFATSCEKSEITKDPTLSEDTEEGFMSTTGNSDSDAVDDNLSQGEQLLHLRYDKGLSKTEVLSQFKRKAAEFLKNTRNVSKGVSNEWFYMIITETGTLTNQGTDGAVRASVRFSTSVGYYTHRSKLDNKGNDREEGDWDVYLLSTEYPNKAVSWVEAREASIELKGKDGWLVKSLGVHAFARNQSVPAKNDTFIVSKPNVWLDNNSDNKWDRYDTGVIGTGRLEF